MASAALEIIRSPQEFQGLLVTLFKELGSVLPAAVTPERFCRIAYQAQVRTPKILGCTKASLQLCVLDSASLGLMVDGIEAAIVPYGQEAKLMPMWPGLVKLAYNHPSVAFVNTNVVCENDEFECEMAEGAIRHVISRSGDRGEFQGAYAIVKLASGHSVVEYMRESEIDAIRAKSPGARKSDSPWNDPLVGYREMARKTVLRRLLKRCPKSYELSQAMNYDNELDKLYRVSPTDDLNARVRAKVKVVQTTGTTVPDEPPAQPEAPATETPSGIPNYDPTAKVATIHSLAKEDEPSEMSHEEEVCLGFNARIVELGDAEDDAALEALGKEIKDAQIANKDKLELAVFLNKTRISLQANADAAKEGGLFQRNIQK